MTENKRYVVAVVMGNGNEAQYFVCEGEKDLLRQMTLSQVGVLIRERYNKQVSSLEWCEPVRVPHPSYGEAVRLRSSIEDINQAIGTKKQMIETLQKTISVVNDNTNWPTDVQQLLLKLTNQRLKTELSRTDTLTRKLVDTRNLLTQTELSLREYEETNPKVECVFGPNSIADWLSYPHPTTHLQPLTVDKNSILIAKRTIQIEVQNQLQQMIDKINQQRKEIEEFKTLNKLL